MLTQEEVHAVDEWRFENRMPSRSAAARALMNLGLSVQRSEDAKEALLYRPISSGEIGIVDNAPTVEAAIKPDCRPVILLADDDFLTGRGIGSMLEDMGYKVIGPVTTTDEAIIQCREANPIAAVLETTIGQERTDKLADELARRHIPYLFCTTSDLRRVLPERLWSSPVIDKRDVAANLPSAVTGMLATVAQGAKERLG
ncbi:hypothetical protein [Pseudokordiimonas caeni]|uniref:hypothetical protein n=1 Tax=Pseudokordiimonas caeni TaxID=2997908 RepID=UPI0028112EA7|nr:hypothetical protein [Pseudokordiimonas caeni]